MMTKKDQGRLAPIAFGAWIPPLLMWVAEQWFSAQPWWPRIQWGTVTGAFFCFSVGFFMRDQWTHHPWFRGLFSSSRVGFSIDRAFVEFVQDGADWFVPTVDIKFWQDTEVGHLVIRVFDSSGDSFVSFEVKDAPHRKGDVLRVPLCWLQNVTSGYSLLPTIWGQRPGTADARFSDRLVKPDESYWIKIAYEWAENSRSSDTLFLRYRLRQDAAGKGVEVNFDKVESYIPEYLD